MERYEPAVIVVDITDIFGDRGASGIGQPDVAPCSSGTDSRPPGVDQKRINDPSARLSILGLVGYQHPQLVGVDTTALVVVVFEVDGAALDRFQ